MTHDLEKEAPRPYPEESSKFDLPSVTKKALQESMTKKTSTKFCAAMNSKGHPCGGLPPAYSPFCYVHRDPEGWKTAWQEGLKTRIDRNLQIPGIRPVKTFRDAQRAIQELAKLRFEKKISPSDYGVYLKSVALWMAAERKLAPKKGVFKEKRALHMIRQIDRMEPKTPEEKKEEEKLERKTQIADLRKDLEELRKKLGEE